MNLNGLVTRIRSGAERRNDVLMETVVCGKCGQRLAIHHDPTRQDVEVARRQASWLEEQLVWDHIQERKHMARCGCLGCNNIRVRLLHPEK